MKPTDCESCGHSTESIDSEKSFYCSLCTPWVISSIDRLGEIAGWANDLFDDGENKVRELRRELTQLMRTEFPGASWGPAFARGDGTFNGGPENDVAWLQVFTWLLGDDHDVVLQIKHHLNYRYWPDDWSTDDCGSLDTVDSIKHQLELLMEDAPPTYADDDEMNMVIDISPDLMIAGHEVAVLDDRIWVDKVLFHNTALDVHCHNRLILPQLMFDTVHGLDNRPIEERAYLYSTGPWVRLLRMLRRTSVPKAPILRENINRLSEGAFGRDLMNRFRMVLLLWTAHPEREYQTRARKPWAKSFQLLRQIIEENSDRIDVEEGGLIVEGSSGNKYSIEPCYGAYRAHGEEYRVWNLSTLHYHHLHYHQERDMPAICILTTQQSSGMPMGDIIATLVMMLLNDVESARKVVTLVAHMPPGTFPSNGD